MLFWCWPTVYDVGPTSKQHWINILYCWDACIALHRQTAVTTYLLTKQLLLFARHTCTSRAVHTRDVFHQSTYQKKFWHSVFSVLGHSYWHWFNIEPAHGFHLIRLSEWKKDREIHPLGQSEKIVSIYLGSRSDQFCHAEKLVTQQVKCCVCVDLLLNHRMWRWSSITPTKSKRGIRT